MSLIRVRRKRKQNWINYHRARSPGRLLAFLVFVLLVIWFLGSRF